MAIKRLILGKDEVSYEGVFHPQTLYNLIAKYFKTQGYDLEELISVVNYKDLSKKHSYLDIRPSKKISDYIQIEFKVGIVLLNLIEENINGKTYYTGKVIVGIEGFMKTDYTDKFSKNFFWEHIFKPFNENIFLKNIIDDGKKKLTNDFNRLKIEIRSYFNLDDFEKRALLR
jgi:hypothetical protein